MTSTKIINLLSYARKHGIQLFIEDGRLKYKATAPFPVDLKAKIKAHKVEIVSLLMRDSDFANRKKSHQAIFPLLPMQKDIARSIDLSDNDSLYNVPMVLEYSGDLDLEKLDSALREVIMNNDVLRACIIVENNQYYHKVLSGDVVIEYTDLRSSKNMDEKLAKHISDTVNCKFDMSVGPLYRISIIQAMDDKYYFCFVFHHIIFDGLSYGEFQRELHDIYCSENVQRQLLGPQYSDFVNWYTSLDQRLLQQSRLYWKSELSSLTRLNLPYDTGDIENRKHSGKKLVIDVNNNVSSRLEHLICAKIKTTRFNFFLAVYMLLLRDYCNQPNIAVGITTTFRRIEEFHTAIGMFVNALPVIISTSGREGLKEYVDMVTNKVRGAFVNNNLSAETLSNLVCNDDKNVGSLFQTMFLYEEVSRHGDSFCNGIVKECPIPDSNTAKFALTVSVVMIDANKYQIEFEYDDSFFSHAVIENFMQGYHELLNQIVSSESINIPICNYHVLNKSDTELYIDKYNSSNFLYDMKTVVDMFTSKVFVSPKSIAVVDGKESLTYKELNILSSLFASWLISKYESRYNIIALKLTRRVSALVAILGVLKAGMSYTPIDPDYPNERIQYILKDSDAPLLVCDNDTMEESCNVELLNIDEYFGSIDWTNLDCVALNINKASLSNVAYIIYTSGSTGKPKGVEITHLSLSHYTQWAITKYIMGAGCGALVHSSLAFDLTITSIFAPICDGKTVFMIPDDQGIDGLLNALHKRHDYSLIKITPAHLRILQSNIDKETLSKIRSCFVIGGEALYLDDFRELLRCAKKAVFINEYGPTEATVGAMNYEVRSDSLHLYDAIPIGAPIGNYKIYVLDHLMRPVPKGVIGEIYISGIGLSRGYLNHSDLNIERFLNNPFKCDKHTSRLYRTGDLAVFNDKLVLQYVGRMDDQVKLNGYRIELGEIESCLSNIDYIKDAVVIIDDEDGKKQIHAFLQLYENANCPVLESLKEAVSKILPFYMRPYKYMIIDSVPLTTNGKVDRACLKKVPSELLQSKCVASPECLTPIVDNFLKIWAIVFNVDIPPGIHDDFFSLGGDSLMAIQIVSKIRELGYVFNSRNLYQLQNINAISMYLESLDPSESLLNICSSDGDVPLAPIQKWFFSQHYDNPDYYLQILPIRLPGKYPSKYIKVMLDRLMNAVDVSRVRFKSVRGRTCQYYINESHGGAYYFRTIEQDISEADKSLILKEYRRIKVFESPLFNILHFKSKNHDDALLIIAHHLVVDGYSWAIIKNYIAKLLNGESIANKTNYKTWSIAVESYGKAVDSLEELAWSDSDTYDQAYQRLFNDKSNGTKSDHFTLEMDAFLIEPSVYSALKMMSMNVGNVLLTALFCALNKYDSSGKGIPITIESYGRAEIGSDIDVSQTVGWFACYYPLVIPAEYRKLSVLSTLRSIQLLRASIPNLGIGYMMRKNYKLPRICFNYLGDIGSIHDDELIKELPVASFPHPVSCGNSNVSQFIIEINVWNECGKIRLAFNFDDRYISKSNAREFIDLFKIEITTLTAMLSSCYTLDVVKKLNHMAYYSDELLNYINSRSEVVAIYPALAGQSLMYRQFKANECAQGFRSQAYWFIDSTVDFRLIKNIWETMHNLMPVFNSNIVSRGGIACQIEYSCNGVVVHEAAINMNYSGDHLTAYIKNIYPKQFHLEEDQLVRCILLSYDDTNIVILDHHHALLDGASIRIIKSIIDDGIQSGKLDLEKVGRLKGNVDYFGSYESRLELESRYFWKKYLADYAGVNKLPYTKIDLGMWKAVEQEQAVECMLDASLYKDIVTAAVKSKVNVNTIFQYVWGRLLSNELSQDDVAYGVVSSGRANLVHPDDYVGMFMNIVPIRVNYDPKPGSIISDLQDLQDNMQQIMEHDTISLEEIEACAEKLQADHLINALYTFENSRSCFAIDSAVDKSEVYFKTITNSPLTIIVKWQVSPLLVFTYDCEIYNEKHINDIADKFVMELKGVIANIITLTHDRNVDGGKNARKIASSSLIRVFKKVENKNCPLILLHGALSGYEVFNKLVPLLKTDIIAIDSYNLHQAIKGGELIDNINDLGKLYIDLVRDKTGLRKFSVLGFSQGGITLTSMLQQATEASVQFNKVIMLDSFLLTNSQKSLQQQLQMQYLQEACFASNLLTFHGIEYKQAKVLCDAELKALLGFELPTKCGHELNLIKAVSPRKVGDYIYQNYLSSLVEQDRNGWQDTFTKINMFNVNTNHFGLLSTKVEVVAQIVNNIIYEE